MGIVTLLMACDEECFLLELYIIDRARSSRPICPSFSFLGNKYSVQAMTGLKMPWWLFCVYDDENGEEETYGGLGKGGEDVKHRA